MHLEHDTISQSINLWSTLSECPNSEIYLSSPLGLRFINDRYFATSELYDMAKYLCHQCGALKLALKCDLNGKQGMFLMLPKMFAAWTVGLKLKAVVCVPICSQVVLKMLHGVPVECSLWAGCVPIE